MADRLRVSDHALLRFLERAGGMDIEGLRTRLEGSFAAADRAAVSIGGGDHLILADDLVYVVRSRTVTTVLPKGGRRDQGAFLRGPRQP